MRTSRITEWICTHVFGRLRAGPMQTTFSVLSLLAVASCGASTGTSCQVGRSLVRTQFRRSSYMADEPSLTKPCHGYTVCATWSCGTVQPAGDVEVQLRGSYLAMLSKYAIPLEVLLMPDPRAIFS